MTYKTSAKHNNRVFNLTLEQFKEIVLQPCVYCGRPSTKGTQLNGIDRIDNAKGYVKGNCAPCCKWCNRMKRVYSNDEFQRHLYIMSFFNTYKPEFVLNKEVK